MSDPRPVLAVLGGSFNPPHIGHTMLPAYLLGIAGVERVLVAPTFDHALGKTLVSFDRRLAWTRAAMAMYGDRVWVSDVEAKLSRASGGAPSYALKLLEAVAEAHPEHRVRLVVGSDIVATGETRRWHRWDRIEAEFTPIVVPRVGYIDGEGDGDAARGVLPEVSSSEVRALLERREHDPRAAATLRGLLPRAVLEDLERGSRGTVAVVGHGNAAHHARRWLATRGWEVLEVSGRRLVEAPAEALAAGQWASLSGMWLLVGDVHLAAVAGALRGVLAREAPPVLHASGSIRAHGARGLRVLADDGVAVGSLHPVCALRRERDTSLLDRACFGVEGDARARSLALDWIGAQPWLDLQGLDDDQRLAYHGACALAANHLAVVRQAAVGELVRLELDAEVVGEAMDTLMQSALDNLQGLGVPAGVTGPAARGDMETVRRHVDALGAEAGALYRLLSEQLVRLLGAD